MKKLIKDLEDNVFYIDSIDGFIPPGYVEVAEEEIADAEITLARRIKVDEIRARRDVMMIGHDRAYLIALKDAADTTAMLADRLVLLDLPEVAQTAVDAMESSEDIQAYDAFAELELSQDYE